MTIERIWSAIETTPSCSITLATAQQGKSDLGHVVSSVTKDSKYRSSLYITDLFFKFSDHKKTVVFTWWSTSIILKMVAPSLVIVMSLSGEHIILSRPLGPREVLKVEATLLAARMWLCKKSNMDLIKLMFFGHENKMKMWGFFQVINLDHFHSLDWQIIKNSHHYSK